MSTLLLTLLLVALGFGIWFLLQTGMPRTGGRSFQTLLQRAGGDMARANRLIEYELRRSPRLSRGQAIQNAILRLDHDRR